MTMIDLGLDKLQEYPTLESVFHDTRMREHILNGVLTPIVHPDGKTRLITTTVKCLKDKCWDNITVACEGLVVRNGRLIARPPGRMWWIQTSELPETMPENFPPEPPEITRLYDGERLVLFHGSDGYQFAAKDMFVSKATLWAGQHYRMYHQGDRWPEGFTPWFWVVGPAWRRLVEYPKEELILGGLTELREGTELSYEAVCFWGRENKHPVGVRFSKGVSEALIASDRHRGLCLSWARPGAPPLKVGISEIGYQQHRTMVETVTPRGILELMRERAELGPLYDISLPLEFREWVRHWQNTIQAHKLQAETETAMIYARIGAPKPGTDMKGRKEAVQKMQEETQHKPWLLGPLLAMMDSRDFDKAVWDAIKKYTYSQPGWRSGV